MSIFASGVTKILDVPGDPGQTVTIGKLTGRHLQRAREASMFTSMDMFRKMGGAQFQQELTGIGDQAARDKKIAEQQADPMNGYDQRTLLYKGIKSWTYPESLKPVPNPSIADAIAAAKGGDLDSAVMSILSAVESGKYGEIIPAVDDLDEDKADWLAREVLKLSKPSLFQTADEAKAEQKND